MTSKKTAPHSGRASYCPNKKLLLPILGLMLWLCGQSQSNNSRFTIELSQGQITTVFQQIERQSNYRVFYMQKVVAKASPVTVQLKAATIKQVLDETFKNQPLGYKIEGNSILVSERSFKEVVGADSLPLITGKVLSSEDGKPLSGATIKVAESNRISITDVNGQFSIRANHNQTLVISFIGYQSTELPLRNFTGGEIHLARHDGELETVNVASSGYQLIPKERATGSFDQIDNKLFNRAVSTDLLSRLEGLGNGLLFANNAGNGLHISIRGRSTLFSNTQPLIVLDNFPYDGRIENINPNDIESITLLKDAAAASIWGTRAGNGVLVITTKRGKLNRPAQVSVTTNLTFTEKPDLHYRSKMSNEDYIEVERFLFEKGNYNTAINRRYTEISPVISILAKQRSGLLTEDEANAQIQALSQNDILSDMEKYLYQTAIKQQHQVNVRGGGKSNSYYLSVGFDKNLSNTVGSSYERYTVKGANTFYSPNQRLQFTSDLNFTTSKDFSLGGGYNNPKYPYLSLADENGTPLEVATNSTLNSGYTDTVGGGLLLDWKYRPLQEIRDRSTQASTRTDNFIVNLNLSYKILKSLSASLYYQYSKQVQNTQTLYGANSYFTRSRINTLSQINRQTGVVTRPIPLGDILNSGVYSSEGNYGRAQLSYQQAFGKGMVNAIAGYEARELYGLNNTIGFQYGYNRANETFIPVDLITLFSNFYSGATATITSGADRSSTTDRNISYYSNIGYVFDERYLATASFRKDESNIFGVSTNQRGVPLWSVGLGWNIHKEKFYAIKWLSYLKLRATYGYNGNVNNSTSAYLTGTPVRTNLWQNPFNRIVNPPNPSLRWEKVQNINFGLDFSLSNNRLNGSIEYYLKNGQDLMGYSPIAPQTGISVFFGNVANTSGKGLDIKLTSVNVATRSFHWESTAIVNLNRDKVTKYLVNSGINEDVIAQLGGIVPIEGKPILSIISYRYAGLSAEGNPMGYLDGKISEDYTAMINSENRSDLVFYGSATPTFFGNVRNSFRYKSFELSFSILFRAGYYFRRASFMSNNLIGAGAWFGAGDYSQRWQNPGDEAVTQVPKLLYPYVTNRDLFYGSSSYLVENASNIRLHDIQFNYEHATNAGKKRPIFSSLNFYLYAKNIGIIWRANKSGLDPDALSGPSAQLNISTGIRASF